MLELLGEARSAARRTLAIEAVTAKGSVAPDLGGDANTADVTRAVCNFLRQ